MDISAQIHSLDALREFRTALVKFRETGSHAMANVEVEIRRALDWLGHDQLAYWKHQVRVREDAVNEAKINLQRRQLMKMAGGETPTCDEEKKQLARAKARHAEAEEKIELIRKWVEIVEHEVAEYHATAHATNMMIDQDVPRAIHELDRLVGRIEAYLDQASAAELGPAETTSEAEATEPPQASTDAGSKSPT